jgi:hypothetical protein
VARDGLRGPAAGGGPIGTAGQEHLPEKRQDHHGRAPEAIAPRVSDLGGQRVNAVLVEQGQQALTGIAELLLERTYIGGGTSQPWPPSARGVFSATPSQRHRTPRKRRKRVWRKDL